MRTRTQEPVAAAALPLEEERASASEIEGVDDEQNDDGEPKITRPDFSEKLMRDITAHRTAALQASLPDRLDVALVVLVHPMAETLFCVCSAASDLVRVTLRPTSDKRQATSDEAIAQDATDYPDSPDSLTLRSAEQGWADRLPGDSMPCSLGFWRSRKPCCWTF